MVKGYEDKIDQKYLAYIINHFKCSKEIAECMYVSAILNNTLDSLKRTVDPRIVVE